MLLPIISHLFSNLFLCAFFEILRILYYMLIPFSGPVPRAGIWDSLFYIRILLNTNNRHISAQFPVSCSGFSSFVFYTVRFFSFLRIVYFLNQIALLRDAFPTFASLSKAVPHRGSLFSFYFLVFI